MNAADAALSVPHATGRARGLGMPSRLNARSLGFTCLVAGNLILYVDRLFPLTASNFLFSDIAFLAAAGLALVSRPGRWLRQMATPLSACFIGFLGCALVSMLYGAADARFRPIDSLAQVVQLTYIFLIILPTFSYYLVGSRELRLMAQVNVFMLFVASCVSVYCTSIGVCYDFNGGRFANPMLDRNGFWIYGAFSSFILFDIYSAARRNELRKTLANTIYLSFGFAGLVLSGTRAGLVLFVLSIVAFSGFVISRIRSRPSDRVSARMRLVLLGLMIAFASFAFYFATAFPILQNRLQNQDIVGGAMYDRVAMNDRAIEHILDTGSLVGVGPGQFLNFNMDLRQTVHNWYLQLWYETGLLGMLLFSLPMLISVAGYAGLLLRKRRQVDIEMTLSMLLLALSGLVVGMVYPVGVSRIDWVPFLLAAYVSRTHVLRIVSRKL